MSAKEQTIFIAVDQGFAARYLLRTDIFRVLKSSGARIVILTPNADEDYFVEEFSDENVFIEPIKIESYREYSRSGIRSKLQSFLRNVRWYIMDRGMDLNTVDTRYNIYKKTRTQNTIKKKIYNYVFDLLVSWLRRSRTLRHLEIEFESKLFTPTTHGNLFNKYRPDKMLITSLGYFGFDHYLIREAKAHKVKIISIILSWDNPSSKGMAGAFADNVVAWTENMKKELIQYHDIKEDRIHVGGVALYDNFFRSQTLMDRKWLSQQFGLVEDRKLIFLCLMSPTQYPWNPKIIELLGNAIREERFNYPCQLLVRFHPIYFTIRKGEFRFKKEIDQLMSIKDKYPNVYYDIPKILSQEMSFDMPGSEMIKLGTILKYTDLLLCFFSSMILEASIFQVPSVNVALFSKNKIPIEDLITHSHIKRVLDTGGTRIAYNEEDLIEIINCYLNFPELDQLGRKKIVEEETGPFRGKAGENIGNYILKI